ncbi:MAG: magnesium and cobalt transport protein CorA [Phycisphaerae bacterium]|nr:magnesium and cobalt transport protein CorA [Phycisphaerae bacterium]
MARMIKTQAKTIGMAPGSIIHIGKVRDEKSDMQLFDYTQEQFCQRDIAESENIKACMEISGVKWLNINGLHDTELVGQVGAIFDIHNLLLEDMVNTSQRPKMEEHDQRLYVILKMIRFDDEKMQIVSEQISLFLHKDWVVTFQEYKGDVFDLVRQRIENSKGKIRSNKADYLFYALLDCIIDNYFIVLEKIGDHIELLQEKVEINSDRDTLNQIHRLKREMLYLRKNIWPVREIAVNLMRNENKVFRGVFN